MHFVKNGMSSIGKQVSKRIPLAEWSELEVTFLKVVGLIPTQWTSMYVLLVGGRWLNKLQRPPGLVVM
jgi:hypothetical protein